MNDPSMPEITRYRIKKLTEKQAKHARNAYKKMGRMNLNDWLGASVPNAPKPHMSSKVQRDVGSAVLIPKRFSRAR